VTQSDIISALGNTTVQKFIYENETIDEHKFLLKGKSIEGVPANIIADQITGRRKSKNKIPSLYKTHVIVYPPGINLEQSSSESTALFKASLGKGKTIVDLTGGFGIDSYFFSKQFEDVHYIEKNDSLLKIAAHNHRILGAQNIKHHLTSAEEFLKTTTAKFDFVYIDPARRSAGNKKVFKLSECEPDVTLLQPLIFEKTEQLLIKTAPLLDINQGLRDLQNVQNVYVISVDNECKELLFLCRRNFIGEPQIETVNLSDKGNEFFNFTFEVERETISVFSDPLKFLYEPNASVLKAGAFKSIGNQFNLNKIQQSTHLYTSDNLINSFPGRCFEILAEVKADTKSLKQFFPDGKANITTRNYPLTPEELKKKTALKDGGKNYLFGFSGMDKKYLVVARRVITNH
jgi:16S rRNA G966 N2-methylase RsmD